MSITAAGMNRRAPPKHRHGPIDPETPYAAVWNHPIYQSKHPHLGLKEEHSRLQPSNSEGLLKRAILLKPDISIARFSTIVLVA